MLRKKTLLGVGATLVLLIILLYLISRQILLHEFLTLESQLITHNLSRVENILDDDEKSMQASLIDWAQWNETYDYMSTRDPQYIVDNVDNDLFNLYGLNLVLYLDPTGNVVYGKGHDASDAKGVDLTNALTAKLTQDKALQAVIMPLVDNNASANQPGISGVVVTTKGPLVIAASPILNSYGKGDRRGTLIWGRYLGVDEAKRLTSLTNLSVQTMYLNTDSAINDSLLSSLQLTYDAPTAIVPVNDNISHGYSLVDGLNGKSAFIFEITVERDIYQRGQLTLRYLVLSLVAAGLVIGAVVLILMDRLVLARLDWLNRDVLQIGQRDDLSLRVAATGSDELANFGRTINTTLDALAHSRAELTALNADLETRVAARTSELQARQNFLQAVLDTMKEGVIFGSPDAIHSVNDVMSNMCGHAGDELIGHPSHLMFDETLAGLFQQVDGSGKPADHGEGWLLCKDGSRLDVAIMVSPLVELDGQVGHIYIVRDISEEKALQARKDRFLADASHELRNPLTNLMTRLYLLRQQPERLETHLEILDSILHHMRSLVEDLLDSSRFNHGTTSLQREVTPLHGLIKAVVEAQRPEADLKHLTLTYLAPDEPIYVSVDAKRITQVVTNLLANAIHYTDPGGSISVALEPDGANERPSAVLTLRDSGIGISQENLSQLFLPFFRVNSDTPGTGLGLAIVKEIIDRHDGEISVESEIGHGTTFTVRLATVPAPQSAAVV